MKILHKAAAFPVTQPRGGTTLTEILMAILCMGIGVVAVASLFPIALLRSVQATQLTNGTILRFNAETLMDLYTDYDPTLLGGPNNNRNLVFNPDIGTKGVTGAPADNGVQQHFGQHYLVDPLGAMIVRQDEGRQPDQTDKVGLINRFDGMGVFGLLQTASTAVSDASGLVTLPDSWVTLYEDFPVGNDDLSVTMPANSKIDYADVQSIIGSSPVRIVLFSEDGGLSETRDLTAATQVNNPAINWTIPLPDNGKYLKNNKVSRVRIEYRERRYTWMLSVRNNTIADDEPRAYVDVVIFFRRAPSLDEERPYLLQGSGRTYTVDKLTNSEWTASYPAAIPYPNPYKEPFLKTGGFFLDTTTGRWHRIAKVVGNQITLERNITGTLNLHHAAFMRKVVEVYSLSR